VVDTGWIEKTADEHNAVWEDFYERFRFKPDYYQRVAPAIVEPVPCITFDLSCPWTDELVDRIGVAFLAAFRSVTTPGERLHFLDWQHPCYWFEPHAADASNTVPVLPDGDYYIFLSADLTYGTFGHPWQQSLAVFGGALLEAMNFGSDLGLDVLRSVGLES